MWDASASLPSNGLCVCLFLIATSLAFLLPSSLPPSQALCWLLPFLVFLLLLRSQSLVLLGEFAKHSKI